MVKLFNEKKRKAAARIDDIVAYICERWVIVVERDAKCNEVSVDGLRSPNGGGGGRPRPFAVVTFWAGFVLAENRGDTVTRAQVSRGICFALVLGSLGCLPMMNGGGFLFLQKRHSLRPENEATAAQVSGWVRRPVRVAAVDDDGRGGGGGMVGGAEVGGGGGGRLFRSATGTS